jgi:hypothetical protein
MCQHWGGGVARRMRRGRKKARFAPSGGFVNLGAAPAIVVGAGMVAVHALRRNRAEPVKKYSPTI